MDSNKIKEYKVLISEVFKAKAIDSLAYQEKYCCLLKYGNFFFKFIFFDECLDRSRCIDILWR